jgi:hypothetical protein
MHNTMEDKDINMNKYKTYIIQLIYSTMQPSSFHSVSLLHHDLGDGGDRALGQIALCCLTHEGSVVATPGAFEDHFLDIVTTSKCVGRKHGSHHRVSVELRSSADGR